MKRSLTAPADGIVERLSRATREAAGRGSAPHPARWAAWWRLARNRTALSALAFLILLVALSLAAPWIAPHPPLQMRPKEGLAPPNSDYWLGTDLFGRDVLSRLLHGGRLTLQIAAAAVAISAPLGVFLGLAAGSAGGLADNAIMRLVDMLLAFPRILLALCLLALLGVGTANVIIAVGVAGIAGYARLVRGTVLAAKEEPYVEAARVAGCGPGRIAVRHLLPNILAPVVVLATLDMGGAVLAGSSLSFLGLGTQPPQPEWGLMLNEGRAYLVDAPWTTMAPGLAIMLTILAINLLGDGLRDALDPRMRE